MVWFPFKRDRERLRFIEQYQIVTPQPGAAPPALLLANVKEQLKIDSCMDDTQDAYLNLLISVVQNFFEQYTGYTLINTTYETYLDQFYFEFELRKAPNVSLLTYQYLLDGVWTDVPSDLYYLSTKPLFNSVNLVPGMEYPCPDILELPIRMTMMAGFGADYTSIPPTIQEALMMHISDLYFNRGDYDILRPGNPFMSQMTKMLYDLNKIRNIVGY